jgi:hypothetical protein
MQRGSFTEAGCEPRPESHSASASLELDTARAAHRARRGRLKRLDGSFRHLARTGGLPLRQVAIVLSAYAAFLHDLVLPAHYIAWWGYGAYFIAATVAQAFYCGALLFWPTDGVLLAGILGNTAMLVLYAVTRGIGIPYFGPEAGQVEPIGAIDLLTAAAEIALVAILVLLMRARSSRNAPMEVLSS